MWAIDARHSACKLLYRRVQRVDVDADHGSSKRKVNIYFGSIERGRDPRSAKLELRTPDGRKTSAVGYRMIVSIQQNRRRSNVGALCRNLHVADQRCHDAG